MCALWGSAARGSSRSEREGAEEGTALANLVVPRDVFHTPPPSERPRGAQARASSWTSQGGVCAEGPPATKTGPRACCSAPSRAHDVPTHLTRMPCQTEAARGRRPSAHRTALCAAPGAAPATTTEAGPGAPREAARGRLPSVRPRAAARPARPRAGAPHRVPHPAPQRTLRRRGRFRSPSTRSSLAQREASGAPRTPARTPSAPGPRARLAPPRKSHLPRFVEGGGDS